MASGDPSDGESCSFSTVQSVRCNTSQDEDGKPIRICENKKEVFRHCMGRPAELIESRIETTEDDGSRALEPNYTNNDSRFLNRYFSESIPFMLHDWYNYSRDEQQENASSSIVSRQFEDFFNREDGIVQEILKNGGSILVELDDALYSLGGFAEDAFETFKSKIGQELEASRPMPKLFPPQNEGNGDSWQENPIKSFFKRWGSEIKDEKEGGKRKEENKSKDYDDFSKLFQDV